MTASGARIPQRAGILEDTGGLKILLIRLSAIGDVVRTLPALTCLRRGYPTAHIDWAVEEASADLLRDQPDLDGLLVFPRRKVSRVLLHPNEFGAARRALAGFFRQIKEARYDLVIDFQGTLKTGVLTRMTGAPRTVGLGRGHARELSHFLLTEPVPLPRKKMSRVDRALALVAHLGVDTTRATSRLVERPADAAYVNMFLSKLKSTQAPVVVFPGTSRTQAYKRYPPYHFARAADLVSDSTGSPVVVAWGPGEQDLAAEVVDTMKTQGTLSPAMSLGQLTELIRRARVFIAGDTGPMHIAWTVGAPVVAVYGPTDPVLNMPGGDFSTVAYRKVFCSPCRNRGCIARTCLEKLPPETVANAAVGMIRKAETAGRVIQASKPLNDDPGADPTEHETMGPGMRPSR